MCNIYMSELLKKVPSCEVIGTGQEPYLQCITEEIKPEERKAMLVEYKAVEKPFKDGFKTRFWLPEGTKIILDVVWEEDELSQY